MWNVAQCHEAARDLPKTHLAPWVYHRLKSFTLCYLHNKRILLHIFDVPPHGGRVFQAEIVRFLARSVGGRYSFRPVIRFRTPFGGAVLQPEPGGPVLAAVALIAENQVQPARQVPPHRATSAYAGQPQIFVFLIRDTPQGAKAPQFLATGDQSRELQPLPAGRCPGVYA